MLEEENEAALLEKADAEEKMFNWAEAAKIYEQIAKNLINKQRLEKAAEIYKKIGLANTRAAHTVDSADKYIEFQNNAIIAYKEASQIFKNINRKPEELECDAEAILIRGFIENSILEAKELFKKSHKLFDEARELYAKKGKQEDIVRITTCELRAIGLQQFFTVDGNTKVELHQKAWDLFSVDLKFYGFDVQAIAETIFHHQTNQIGLIKDYKGDKSKKDLYKKILSLYNEMESLKLIENCNNSRALGLIYSVVGNIYFNFGFMQVESDREQREYFSKGLELLKKGVDHVKKTNDKSLIISCIFLLDYDAIIIRKFEYIQRRILKDIDEVLGYSEIYSGSLISWYLFANDSKYLPALYYTSIASILIKYTNFKNSTVDQRIAFAEKAINYAEEFLDKISLNPEPLLPQFIEWYYVLTLIYTQLSSLSLDLNKRNNYAKKMIQYANKASEIGEKYEGGTTKSFGHSCRYRAYKILADFADTKEKRIQMLSIAIEANQKYIQHPLESRSGIIEGHMRLGLLYEELGIVKGESNPLLQAKDIFLEIIQETIERGYIFYRATAHEYIARIEDRIGDHTASAKNYKKAQLIHEESLKKVEYEPLKKRIRRKINYAQAWNLIEQAKMHHKREDHLNAKEYYEKASEILKNVHRNKYEAPYYFAWALLEDAEHHSKQERQIDAIEDYKATKMKFEEAIQMLRKVSKRSKENSEKERLEKLEKVAKLRMDYCTARINLEKARILAKQGKHSEAAENFALSASQLRQVCTVFKVDEERKELEAMYYLCRAWERMELAEKYGESDRYAEAADLFTKASNLFTDTKLKLLAAGHSAFCLALENGCKFDDSIELETKSQLYPKVKSILRKAADSYRKGGFESGADWALATSTYFDATWHLIKADEELDVNEKKNLLGMGSRYLKSAAELFNTAGHKDKVFDVQRQLEMVEREEIIILSALNTVKRPAISSSTIGILAPTCPIEISQSPRIGEIRQVTEESIRVQSKRLGESTEIYECDTTINILHLSDIQEGRFGIKEDISTVDKVYHNFLSDLKDKLEILHRKNKIDIVAISGDLTSIGSKEEFYHLTNEFLPILNEVFLNGPNIVPKNRWIIVPGNHDVEWDKGDARFNNFIQFCQENGFHQYKLNNPESIYSRIICRDNHTGNVLGIVVLNSCLEIFDENSSNISNISNSYFSSFSKDWDFDFREIPKLMVCHHTLHSIKKDRFNNALNKLSDNNVLLALAGDIHKSDSHADEISNIRCIPAGTILAKKTERQVGIDEVSRQFNLINLNLQSGYVKWYTYSFEGTWREIKNQSFYLEHDAFSKEV